MEKKTKILIVIAFTLLIVGASVLGYKYLEQTKAYNEVVDVMAIQKDSIQREYEDYLVLFDGYQQKEIRNDSLQELLNREQQRVQDLLEELRETKASNARKITELRNELASVRAVTQNLVRQIDSLNATNKRLAEENIQVRQENKQVKAANEQLTDLNHQLTETVSRASMLEVTSCSLTGLNKHDKKTSYAHKMRKLQFDFVIGKNITCEPGMKDLYARIIDPKGNLLGESEERQFPFENLNIEYSLTQQIEYSGDRYTGVCYYALGEEENMQKGIYSIDFFCDGNLIGSFPLEIKK